MVIPPIEYCYFDAGAGAYRIARTNAIRADVIEGADPRGRVVVDQSGRRQGALADAAEIRPLVPCPADLARRDRWAFAPSVLVVLPVLLYLGVVAHAGYRRRAAGSLRGRDISAAAVRRLSGLPREQDVPAELHRTVVGFIAHAFGVVGHGMTAAEAEAVLRAHGVDEETTGQIGLILRRCERDGYAGDAIPPDELRALIHGAAGLVRTLAEVAPFPEAPQPGETEQI